jgi:transposase
MESTKEMVTLPNGKLIPWNIFSSWNAHKQSASIRGVRENFEWRAKQSQKLSAIHTDKHKKGCANLVSSSGNKNASSRAVITPDGQFETLRSAASHFNVSVVTLGKWLRDDRFVGFKFAEERIYYSTNKPLIVITPEGQFKSKSAAARHFGVTVGVMKTWLSNVDGFSYVEDSIQSESNFSSSKPVTTPNGQFRSLREASKFYKVQANTIATWIKKSKPGFFYSGAT